MGTFGHFGSVFHSLACLNASCSFIITQTGDFNFVAVVVLSVYISINPPVVLQSRKEGREEEGRKERREGGKEGKEGGKKDRRR